MSETTPQGGHAKGRVGEAEILKTAVRIEQRAKCSPEVAMKRARRWAANVNARASEPRMPQCPGPRCQCDDCAGAALARGRGRASNGGYRGGGCW